ncbi:MAG: OmpA family protein [Bacteroidaceae bacterium]|nr:OmpA family protein [Bacteroidaceae bacterium]
MRKFMMALAFAGIAMTSFAQETVSEVVVPTKKNSVVTNSFGSNWFLGVNGGVNLFNGARTGGESAFDHLTPSVSVYAGKWHTPGYGWRVAYNGWELKPYENVDEMGYMNIHFDAMFNLSNLICGYNESRIWNVIPYVGVGWAGIKSVKNDDAYQGSLSANYGILNTFRVSKHWAINLELNGAFFRNGFSGRAGRTGMDMMWGAQVGVTYKFNKTGWEAAPDTDALLAMNAAALAELAAQLQAKESENSQLKQQLASAKSALVQAQNRIKALENEPKYVDVAQSVFFAFNSSRIESKKEIINLQALADAAKNAGVKLSVVGYADSATGSAAYNQKLSVARANAVADKLVELGVSRDQLVVEGKGGVAVENPARLNRRVIISIVK